MRALRRLVKAVEHSFGRASAAGKHVRLLPEDNACASAAFAGRLGGATGWASQGLCSAACNCRCPPRALCREDVNIVIVMRAMGIESDAEVLQLVGTEGAFAALLAPTLQHCREEAVFTRQQALDYLASERPPPHPTSHSEGPFVALCNRGTCGQRALLMTDAHCAASELPIKPRPTS